jgi:hypothetical protein
MVTVGLTQTFDALLQPLFICPADPPVEVRDGAIPMFLHYNYAHLRDFLGREPHKFSF